MKNLKGYKKIALLVALVMIISAFLAIPMFAEPGVISLEGPTTPVALNTTFKTTTSINTTVTMNGLEANDSPDAGSKFTISYVKEGATDLPASFDITPTWVGATVSSGAVGTISGTLEGSDQLNAGEYTIVAKYVTAGADLAAAADGSVVTLGTLTVDKATPTITTAPTTNAVDFRSFMTLSEVTINNDGVAVPADGTFAWQNPDQQITAAGNYKAVYTPKEADQANYTNKTDIDVAVTLNETTVDQNMIIDDAEASIARAVKAGNIHVNKTFDEIAAAITGGGIVPSYFGAVTYNGANGSEKPALGAQTMEIKVPVSNVAGFYNLGALDGTDVIINVNINVVPETIIPAFPAAPLATEFAYGTQFEDVLDLTTGLNTAEGTYSYTINGNPVEATTLLNAGANQIIVATFTPNANYQVAAENATKEYAPINITAEDVVMGNITTDLTLDGSVYQIDYAQDFSVAVTVDEQAAGLSSIADNGTVQFSVNGVDDTSQNQVINSNLVFDDVANEYVAVADFNNIRLNIGNYEINAKYVPNAVSNYNEASATPLDAKINPSQVDIEYPDMAVAAYGMRLRDAVLANITSDGSLVEYENPMPEEGEFQWTDADHILGVEDIPAFIQGATYFDPVNDIRVNVYSHDLDFITKDPNREDSIGVTPVVVIDPIFIGSPRRPIKVGESFVFTPTNDDQVGSNGWNVIGNENGVIDITFNSPATITAMKPGKVIVTFTDLNGVMASEVVEVVAADAKTTTSGAATGDSNVMIYIAIIGTIALAGAGFVTYKKIKANKQ